MERTKFLYTLFLLNLDYAFGSESHSLVFLSTGRVSSKGSYDFEQLTVYDGVTVSHCDGLTKKERLKSTLQKSSLPADCEKPYANIREAITNIQDHSNYTVDVVQRRQSCSRSPNGTVSAVEAWAVNGNEFLTFDPDTLKWTSQSPSALKVKELWDKQNIRSDVYRNFLRHLCPKMVQEMTLKSTPKNTELHIFAKPVEGSNEAFLCCHVTTTDRSVKSVRLIGDGATRVSGFSVVGPLPAGGDARVLRLTAGISLSLEGLSYGCEVQSQGHSISAFWNGNTLDGRHIYHSLWDKAIPAIIGLLAVMAVILTVSCLTICLLRIIKIKRRPPPPPPRPELTEQFESFIRSSTLYPDVRNYLLSFISGPRTQENYRDDYNQWFEMMERQNCFDPEFYGRQNGPNRLILVSHNKP
ncbi:uncharacterized protein [Eucyclogobius newberryi]|uniref:uncharacterized protein n=1 Tax=Eucyclogobius newberryi TaxID=166745 RepID=UPI003B5A9C71